MEHHERQAEGNRHPGEVNSPECRVLSAEQPGEDARDSALRTFRWSNAIDTFFGQLAAVFPTFLKAAGVTLLLTVLSMPLAVVFGLVLAVMRRSSHWIVSWPAALYIEIIRGTPLLVQIWLVYFTLPQVGLYFGTSLLTLPEMVVGVMCLAGNYAAYEAEIHRAGLEAIDKGQREAALSIGMSERQAFFRVVLPQAFRIVVPPIINDLIAMLKDSCLVSVIGVRELLNVAQDIGRSRSNTAQMLVFAAVFYLALSVPCYFLGKYVQRRLQAGGAPELHLDNIHGH